MKAVNFQVSIAFQANASPRDEEDFRAAVPDIAAIFFQRHEFRQQERMAEYVDLLLKDVPMRKVDKRVADLQALAMARVYQGCEWLTADEVGKLGGHGKANPAAAAHRWKEQGLVFALRRSNRDMYPQVCVFRRLQASAGHQAGAERIWRRFCSQSRRMV